MGGTNPSLLEALGSTNLNLLLDVGFNREVAGDAALYWNKNNGNLARLIDNVEAMGANDILMLGKKHEKELKINIRGSILQICMRKYSEL